MLHFGDPDDFRARTGVVLNAACCVAKIAWVTDHEPERFAAARWILAPRDFVIARLTGVVLTDETLASRTGLYGLDGTIGVAESIASKLPDVSARRERRAGVRRRADPRPRGSRPSTRGADRRRRRRPGLRGPGDRRARRRADGLVGHDDERLGAPRGSDQ